MPDALETIRAFAADRKNPKVKPDYRPPRHEDFEWGRVLAWDPSLANTAWVVLDVGPERIQVTAHGVIKATVPAVGFAGTFAIVPGLWQGIRKVLYRYPEGRSVIEMPVVRGERTDSSLVAGVLIQAARAEMCIPAAKMVARDHAASVLAGDRHASKAASGAVVDALLAPQRPATPWNEHTRDAALVGLLALRKEDL